MLGSMDANLLVSGAVGLCSVLLMFVGLRHQIRRDAETAREQTLEEIRRQRLETDASIADVHRRIDRKEQAGKAEAHRREDEMKRLIDGLWIRADDERTRGADIKAHLSRIEGELHQVTTQMTIMQQELMREKAATSGKETT